MRKDIDAQAVYTMLILCMLWGMQQVVLKAAADDMAPILQIAWRSAIAVVLIGLFIYIKKQQLHIKGIWPFGLLAGFFFSLEYFFVGESLKYTSASHATVFLYSAPVFVAFTLHFLQPSEKLSKQQWAGIIMAFSGMACTFLLREEDASAHREMMLRGDFLALLSGILWAGATVVIRCSPLNRIPAAQTLFYQILVATLLLSFLSIYTEQTHFDMTLIVWSSILYQGVIVCSFSFVIWLWLLKKYSAAKIGVFSFITPIYGIIFSVLLLGESLELSFIFGTALVLIGITLVTLRKNQTYKTDRPSSHTH